MSGPYDTDLERRVADVLHSQARVAMSRTDTAQGLLSFREETASADRRRLVTWGAAAVATAAAVVVLFLSGLGALSADRGQTQVPAQERTPVEVAADFVEAVAAHDVGRASRDLAADARMMVWADTDRVPQWREEMRWAAAVDLTVLPRGCVRTGTVREATSVRCGFDWHNLGSDRLGIGPFEGNFFDVMVERGRIVLVRMDTPLGRNGHGVQVWEPFVAWLEEAHPEDAAEMLQERVFGDDLPTYTDAVLAKWARYVDEWVGVARGHVG